MPSTEGVSGAQPDLPAFKRAFRQMAAGVDAIAQTTQQHVQATAPAFNIFRMLGVDTDEVRTHSRLLADLLNPNGSHGQGHLFLRTFLSMCNALDQERWVGSNRPVSVPASPLQKHPWHVETERTTARHGRLDITVQCPRKGYLYVIENKINSGEQDHQLTRYAEWLAGQHATQTALLYLTPGGRPSQETVTGPYYALSYRSDVATWLRRSLLEVSAPQLRAVLHQYIEIIEALYIHTPGSDHGRF